jgi:hypothetical protein
VAAERDAKVANQVVRLPGFYDDVVHIRLDRSPDVISKNVLHAALIRYTRVSEAERHRDVIEHPERRDERSRELVGLLHLYLVIPGVDIKEAKQLTPSR